MYYKSYILDIKTISVQDKKLLIAILAAVITSMVFMNTGNTTSTIAQATHSTSTTAPAAEEHGSGEENQTGGTVVRDSSTIYFQAKQFHPRISFTYTIAHQI